MPGYNETVKRVKAGLADGTAQFETDYGMLFCNDNECYFVWKDGKYADLQDVFSAYGLTHLGASVIKNAELSADKKYLYFDSCKERAVAFGSHVFENYDEGRYCLDLKNFIIKPLF